MNRTFKARQRRAQKTASHIAMAEYVKQTENRLREQLGLPQKESDGGKTKTATG